MRKLLGVLVACAAMVVSAFGDGDTPIQGLKLVGPANGNQQKFTNLQEISSVTGRYDVVVLGGVEAHAWPTNAGYADVAGTSYYANVAGAILGGEQDPIWSSQRNLYATLDIIDLPSAYPTWPAAKIYSRYCETNIQERYYDIALLTNNRVAVYGAINDGALKNFRVLDYSNKYHIVKVGELGGGHALQSIYSRGNDSFVYGCGDSGLLRVYDFADPSNVAQYTYYLGPYQQWDLVGNGSNMLFVSGVDDGRFRAFTVTDKTNLVCVYTNVTGGYNTGVDYNKDANVVYHCNYLTAKVYAYKITGTDLTNTAEVACQSTPNKLCYHRGYLYVTKYGGSTLDVFDCRGANATNPVRIVSAFPLTGVAPTYGDPVGSADSLYIGDETWNVMAVYNVSDPTNIYLTVRQSDGIGWSPRVIDDDKMIGIKALNSNVRSVVLQGNPSDERELLEAVAPKFRQVHLTEVNTNIMTSVPNLDWIQTQGYITSFSSLPTNQWNTAYSWGDHKTNQYSKYGYPNVLGLDSALRGKFTIPEYINVAHFVPMASNKVFVCGFTAAGGNYYWRILDYTDNYNVREQAIKFGGTSRHFQDVYGATNLNTAYGVGNGGALNALTYSGTNLLVAEYTLPSADQAWGVTGDGENKLFVSDTSGFLYCYQISGGTNLVLQSAVTNGGLGVDCVWNPNANVVYQLDYYGNIHSHTVSGYSLTKVGTVSASVGSLRGVCYSYQGTKLLIVTPYYSNWMDIYDISVATNPVKIVNQRVLDGRTISVYNNPQAIGCYLMLGFEGVSEWKHYAVCDLSVPTNVYVAAYARGGIFHNPWPVDDVMLGYGQEDGSFVLYVQKNNVVDMCHDSVGNWRYNTLRVVDVDDTDDRSVPNVGWMTNASVRYASVADYSVVAGSATNLVGPTSAVAGVLVTMDVRPSASNVYDLGSVAMPYRSGYFGTNSVFLGNYGVTKTKAMLWDTVTQRVEVTDARYLASITNGQSGLRFGSVTTVSEQVSIGSVQSLPSSWSSTSSLPAARFAVRVGTLGDKLYACGGSDPFFFAKKNVYAFDGASWSEVAELPQERKYGYVEALGSYLYYAGGSDSTTVKTNVYRFNGSSWSEVAGLPSAVDKGCSAVFGNSLYVIGGVDGSGVTTNVYRFNGSSWSAVAGLPAPRYNGVAFVLGSYIYYVAGTDGANVYTNAYKFDGSSWSSAPGFPLEVMYAASAVVGGKAYVFGGMSGPSVSDKTYSFDGTKWTMESSMPVGMWIAGGAAFNSKVYSVAGQDDAYNVVDSVYVFTPSVDIPDPIQTWKDSLGNVVAQMRVDGLYLGGSVVMTNVVRSFGGVDRYPETNAIAMSSVFETPGRVFNVRAKTQTGTAHFNIVRQYYTNDVLSYTVVCTGVVAGTKCTNISLDIPVAVGECIGTVVTNLNGVTNLWYSIGYSQP